MKQEWRNLKGEIVRTVGRDRDPDTAWWRLSGSTWLLLFGLILFNIGCFIDANLIDRLLRFLDVRLWPWWYFPITLIFVAFSVGWFVNYWRKDDYDEAQTERAKRFTRFSLYITAIFILFAVIHPFFFMRQILHSLIEWFRYGNFSLLALGSFLVIIVLIIPAIYWAKEWIVSIIGDR